MTFIFAVITYSIRIVFSCGFSENCSVLSDLNTIRNSRILSNSYEVKCVNRWLISILSRFTNTKLCKATDKTNGSAEHDFDYGFKTEVLAASFKNSQQLLELCEYGVGASTVSPEVIFNLVKNEAITSAIDDFIADFEGLVGEGKTMKDC